MIAVWVALGVLQVWSYNNGRKTTTYSDKASSVVNLFLILPYSKVRPIYMVWLISDLRVFHLTMIVGFLAQQGPRSL